MIGGTSTGGYVILQASVQVELLTKIRNDHLNVGLYGAVFLMSCHETANALHNSRMVY